MDPAYPRPQLARLAWQSLDGRWAFSRDETADAEAVEWRQEIVVPYPPESALSEVAETGYHPVAWYQRSFTLPQDWRGRRILLHFGAVDYRAQVWLNGHLVASHEGGHTPFSADVTGALAPGEQLLMVRAEDDPHAFDQPRGKQDWLPEPHGIWYPRTTGIWQSVWLEPVAPTHIARLRFSPDLAGFAIGMEVQVAGEAEGLSLDVRLLQGDRLLAGDSWELTGPSIARSIHLPDPGIDDARRGYLWSPEHPVLFDVQLTLRRGETALDEVRSYTALRTAEARKDGFYLNGRPYFLRMVLDQGYWDQSLLAAPGPEALRKDVELAKAMGFNGVRKHQKLEDPRYLAWADRLGLLVWEELPSAYTFSTRTVARLTREWLEAIERDANHPCIVAWVAFNESWGVPDLPASAPQRHAVRALYHLAKALDPSRPVIGNDGWEHVVTDLLTVHDYHPDPQEIERRYHAPEAPRETVRFLRPGNRSIFAQAGDLPAMPVILSEFGGIRFHPGAQGWGYQQADSPEALLEIYRALVAAASGPGLSGFCYTQFADTFQEQNGLLYADRRPKVDVAELSRATRNGG